MYDQESTPRVYHNILMLRKPCFSTDTLPSLCNCQTLGGQCYVAQWLCVLNGNRSIILVSPQARQQQVSWVSPGIHFLSIVLNTCSHLHHLGSRLSSRLPLSIFQLHRSKSVGGQKYQVQNRTQKKKVG